MQRMSEGEDIPLCMCLFSSRCLISKVATCSQSGIALGVSLAISNITPTIVLQPDHVSPVPLDVSPVRLHVLQSPSNGARAAFHGIKGV